MSADYIFDTQGIHYRAKQLQTAPLISCAAGSVLIVVGRKVMMHRLPLADFQSSCVTARIIKLIRSSLDSQRQSSSHYSKHHINEPHLLRIAQRRTNTEDLTSQVFRATSSRPTVPLQQKFAAIVQRFERLRAQQREAERQAEHLFQTLLHRAFNDSV